jgi:hypothetical protein
MTAGLVWNKPGEHFYETGVDRGVLQLPGGKPIVWNGLTSVETESNLGVTPYYQDGAVMLVQQIQGEMSGSLSAYMYPDEFEQCIGIATRSGGLKLYEQPSKRFNLSYRTRIGNDINGVDHGYKIHFLWNLLAVPDAHSYSTISDSPEPEDFSWNLSSIPSNVSGFAPTAHFYLSSTTTDPAVFDMIEDMIYGTEDYGAYFPTPQEVLDITDPNATRVTIIDRGNGLWSAFGPASKISRLTPDTLFQITGVNTTNQTVNGYTVSTT